MQKRKKENTFLEKIVKKDFNDELEEILEKKKFDENAKNILLSILYKIEASYKDYETVKQNVETKNEFIEMFFEKLKNNCDYLKIVKINTKESEILKDKSFILDKKSKTIICYPIERKVLYSVEKISKRNRIVKDKYFILNKSLSDLINIGNSINQIEPLRDFNGFSWITIPKEIESLIHNLVYQNLLILVGHNFINKWIYNNEFIMDYFDLFKNKLEDLYGEELKNRIVDELCILSILIEIKLDNRFKKELEKKKVYIEAKVDEIKDNAIFVKEVTKEKRKLTKEIKKIDEILSNKKLLQKEYEKRNKKLSLESKIFSIKVLSKTMEEERNEKLKQIEKLNNILNPKKFIKYKDLLEEKSKYLYLLDIKDIDKKIQEQIINLQKDFLKCFIVKINKAQSKQELMKLFYEFRYYLLIPHNLKNKVCEIRTLKKGFDEVSKLLIVKANNLKLLSNLTSDINIDCEILKSIFKLRIINLENLYVKIIKENDEYFLQLFDEKISDEKIRIDVNLASVKKDLKLNRKIKLFN